MQTVTIAHNAVTAKLMEADRDLKLDVQQLLSYQVEGAESMASFKSGRWDGRSSFLDFRAGTFPAGFVHLVHSHLVKTGHKVNIVKYPLPEPLGPVNPAVDDFGFDPRYDYQMKTVDALTKHGQIIAQLATGAGKSRVAKLAYARIGRMTLFLTTRGILMHQMKSSFEQLGRKVGVLGDSEWTPRKSLNVGMVQTLVARLKDIKIEDECQKYLEKEHEKYLKAASKGQNYIKKSHDEIIKIVTPKVATHQERRQKTITLLGMFEFVILEEAHEASGNSYYEILRHCKNAHYRLALTATPFMRDSEESNMRLMACSGPIGIKVSEQTLIERGILAKPYFKYIAQPKRPNKVFRTTAWQTAYKLGIVENDWRNRAVVYEASRAAGYGMTVMVLVQRQNHGEILKQMLIEQGVKAEFIFGEDDHAARQAALNKLKNGEISVLIGSTILDVGVDVPAVGMVILAGGGKAEVALRQRIGRGLRAKKSGPNVALVVDFLDEWNSHTMAHAMQRQNIVASTPGFAENILPQGEDFDFVGLGLAKRAA